jgi:hypothetical protein
VDSGGANWRSFERAIKLALPLSLGRGMTMTAVGEQKMPRTEPQELNEVEASIAAIEKALFGPRERNREAIHELGCRIVAHALKVK